MTLSMQVSWKQTARVPEETVASNSARLTPYTEQLEAIWQSGAYEAPESSLVLPADERILRSVTDLSAALKTERLRFVVVVGIGGSSLGARAVYEALFGHTDSVDARRIPRAIFLETFDAVYHRAVRATLAECSSPEEIAIVVASKSGTTVETLANAALLLQELSPHFSLVERTVLIADSGAPLHKVGQALGFHTLTLPTPVGGRYSVFSPVGLLPLSLLSVQVAELCAGASDFLSRTFTGEDTAAADTAALLFHAHANGMRVHDLFLFSPALESLGKWYRQLLAESIGKERGSERVGFTPTVSLGTTDLHSVAQLTFAGPRDKITTFVYDEAPPSSVEPRLTEAAPLLSLVPSLAGRSLSELRETALANAQRGYGKQELPFLTCSLSGITERELGAFMQYAMLYVMHLGALLEVNAFDQPAVEAYKKDMRLV